MPPSLPAAWLFIWETCPKRNDLGIHGGKVIGIPWKDW